MGACVNSANSHDSSLLISSSSVQNNFQFDIALISKSYFYFLLRKQIYDRLKNTSINNQFIDLRDTTQFENNHTYLTKNLLKFQDLDTTSKILYDYRNIIIVDEQQKKQGYILKQRTLNFVKRIKELNIKPKKILILQNPISQFIKQYSLFAERSKNQSLQKSLLSKNNIPILTFSSEEVLPKSSRKLKIYLQQDNFYQKNLKNDSKFYDNFFQIQSKIKVSIIQSDNPEEIIEDVTKKLIKIRRDLDLNKSDSVIILTSDQNYHSLIIKQIMQYVCSTFFINYLNGLQYFAEKFPTLSQKISNQQKKKTIWKEQQISSYSKKSQNMIKNEEFLHYLIKYHKETGKKHTVTEKAFNLIMMLLDNLINNTDPQQYRNIKTTNNQLGQYLFKYNYGIKLLEAIGFYQQKKGNMYRNELEQKYLKNYQIDLALAYKNFTSIDSIH